MKEVNPDIIGQHIADMLKKRKAKCGISQGKTLGGDKITYLKCAFEDGNIAQTSSVIRIEYLTKSGFIREFVKLQKGPILTEKAKVWLEEHKNIGEIGLES